MPPTLKHYFGIDRTLSDVVSYNRKHEQNTTRPTWREGRKGGAINMVHFAITDIRKYGGHGFIIEHIKGALPVKIAKQIDGYISAIYGSREEAEKALEEIKKIVEKAL